MRIQYLHNTPMDSEKANLIQVKAMCKAMANRGYDVILSIPGNKPSKLTFDEYKYHFRKQIVKNKYDKYINIFSLLNSIKIFNPDFIFIRDPLVLFYVFLFTNKKVIFESHSFNLHQGSKILNKFYHILLRNASLKGRIVRFVSISHALKNYWVKQGIPSKIQVSAHDGVDLNMFLNNLSKTEIRDKLHLPLDKTIVTYSGRIYANRKIDSILTLATKFPEIYFLVVGGPNENARNLKKEASKLNLLNVFFAGQVKHEIVPDYLAASDILLALWSSDVPTINYCSPLKLFEYMASNKLILAHGFPTIKEVLKDKQDALLIKPGNLNDLVNKLHEAIYNVNRSVIAKSAYDKVLNKYTWQNRVDIIFKFLSKEGQS